MATNPLPIILVVFLIKNSSSVKIPIIDTLQMESILDNAKQILVTIDKVNGLTQNGGPSLPDMNKLMELAGPILSSMGEKENT